MEPILSDPEPRLELLLRLIYLPLTNGEWLSIVLANKLTIVATSSYMLPREPSDIVEEVGLPDFLER